MAQVQQRFGRELPLTALFQQGTVEGMAARLREDESAVQDGCLVPIQASGSAPPLFLAHPAGGDVLCFAALARHLGPRQPVYGLQARGLTRDEEPVATIAAMAELYVEEIRKVQPRGPYFLGGWSLGGPIAFEMARHLRRQGDEVALLALIDATADIPKGPEESDVDFLLDIARYLETLRGKSLGLDWEDLAAVGPEGGLALLIERMSEAGFLPPGAGEAQLRRVLRVYRATARAARAWEPGPWPGRVTLLKAADESDARDPREARGFDLGWSRVAGAVEVTSLPGSHLTLLAEPNVRALAQRLRICLEDAHAEKVEV
jgi:thioesterase domain-containing protein